MGKSSAAAAVSRGSIAPLVQEFLHKCQFPRSPFYFAFKKKILLFLTRILLQLESILLYTRNGDASFFIFIFILWHQRESNDVHSFAATRMHVDARLSHLIASALEDVSGTMI